MRMEISRRAVMGMPLPRSFSNTRTCLSATIALVLRSSERCTTPYAVEGFSRQGGSKRPRDVDILPSPRRLSFSKSPMSRHFPIQQASRSVRVTGAATRQDGGYRERCGQIGGLARVFPRPKASEELGVEGLCRTWWECRIWVGVCVMDRWLYLYVFMCLGSASLAMHPRSMQAEKRGMAGQDENGFITGTHPAE